MAFSKLELAMGALLGLELATPGMTRAAAKASLGVVARLAPVAGRAALASPMATGVGLGLGALQTAPGDALLAASEERGRRDRLRLERFVQDTLAIAPIKAKKKVSSFNRAVSKGMKTVKASTSFGKKGVISNAKKAFSLVTKTVSSKKQGKKAPKRGIKRKIWGAIGRVL
jgi:hypothetical protein